MANPENTYLSPYINGNGSVPEYLRTADQLWQQKLAAATAMGIINPSYLFIPDAVWANIVGVQLPKKPIVQYIEQSRVTFSDHGDLCQVVVTENGQKYVRWIPVAELCANQSTLRSLKLDHEITTQNTTESVPNTQVTETGTTVEPELRQRNSDESLIVPDTLHKNDYVQAKVVIQAISAALQTADFKPNPLSKYYTNLAKILLDEEDYLEFIDEAKIQLPLGDFAKHFRNIVLVNGQPDFIITLLQLYEDQSFHTHASINNYNAPEISGPNEYSNQLVAKIWYFIINQPKIKLDERYHILEKKSGNKNERNLVQRWHMLLQLPSDEIVILFLHALGIKNTLIDALFQLDAGVSKQVLQSFFIHQAARTDIIHDVKILNFPTLCATFHNVLDFNPYQKFEELIGVRKSELGQVTWENAALACERILHAASEGRALQTAGLNDVLRRSIGGLRFSPGVVKDTLKKHFPVRPDENFLNIADIIWLTRAFRVYESNK